MHIINYQNKKKLGFFYTVVVVLLIKVIRFVLLRVGRPISDLSRASGVSISRV